MRELGIIKENIRVGNQEYYLPPTPSFSLKVDVVKDCLRVERE